MKNLRWTNFSFFVGVPLVGLVGGALYVYFFGLTWIAVFLFFFMLAATLMGITAGYHRLCAHRSYQAAPWLKFLLLAFGAGAFQESCLKWSAEHRAHHRHVDQARDPYNIKRGFFWAHMGWIISAEDPKVPFPQDLQDDRLVMWQHRWWIPLGILVCFGLPTAIGALFGDAMGGLLFGGFLRLAVAHHLTFMINSLAHTIGTQNYSLDSTARDSWITAIVTFGEGYHNYHHWYARDYRNGIRFYHWDPGKWLIRTMSWFGQAWDLKQAPEEAILKARLTTQWRKCQAAPRDSLQERLGQLYESMNQQIEEFMRSKRTWIEAKHDPLRRDLGEKLETLKNSYQEAKREYQNANRSWRDLVRQLQVSLTAA